VGSLLAAIDWRSRVYAEFAMPSYTNYPRAIYNYARESDNNFYAGNTRKVEAESILGQTKAALEEIKRPKSYRLAIWSDKLLELFPLITESRCRRVFLFVRLCNVTTFYQRLVTSKRIIREYGLEEYGLNYFCNYFQLILFRQEKLLLEKLEDLRDLIDKEDGK
jgi:hypothetical protein